MSRTRHHDKLNETRHRRKKSSLSKQKTLETLRIEDWYIELPVTMHLRTR